MDHQDRTEELLRGAETALEEENYEEAAGLFEQALALSPDQPVAAFYLAVARALRDGADYRSIASLAMPAEELAARLAERSGSGQAYFTACRKALSAVVDVTSCHYEAVQAYRKRERRHGRRAKEAAEAAESVVRECAAMTGETAKRAVSAVLEHAEDVTAADDFFWDSAMILLDNAEAYRVAAGMGRDEEITGLFGEIDRLRGNISGEFSGEEELIESDLSGEAFTEVTCPGCGETLSFPAADLTGEVECPFCGNRFTAGS